jgi:hypothetical protein
MDSRNGIVHGTTSIEPCMVREYGGHRPKGPRPTFGGNFSNGAVTRQRASCLVGSSSAWCLVGGAWCIVLSWKYLDLGHRASCLVGST